MAETFRPAFPDRSNSPRLSYGIPFTESVSKHASDTFHASRIYVLCSRSLARNTGYLAALKAQLGDRCAGVRIGMKPHSHWSEILEVVSDARECGADLIVTLGGGSLTDGAKVVSLALANNTSTPTDLETLTPTSPNHNKAALQPARIPIICVPTSLSGGEYSAFAGATNDATGRKHSFSTGLAAPALVVLDPQLSTTTPSHVWLSTGVKAVDHCVETLCSLGSDEAADADARRGLGSLVRGLLKCKHERSSGEEGREDLEARLECQLGVVDAMSACGRGVPLGASHGIGHQLGPAGVGHGETSCVLCPAVCRYNYARGANVARQDAVAEMLWEIPEAAELFEKEKGLNRGKGEELGGLLDVFIRELGMPRTLREFGIVEEERLEGIAVHSLTDRWVQSNPAKLDKEGVLEILRMVLG
ncbi:putative Fe-containing alcohol dehydrogenase [Xylariomycetidae sp. FL2044]|nr:putative Fe-containing alcohol dehydrogenase [Xylariomycetidae sp. FL2044]